MRGVALCDAEQRAVRMAGSLTDITEGKVADALTGLPNRVLFMDGSDVSSTICTATSRSCSRCCSSIRQLQEHQRQSRPSGGR